MATSNIAYQILGDGAIDLVFIRGWMSHLELMWEEPSEARFYRRLASFSRLILFDKRGIGLSDRIPGGEPPLLEERIDDIRAVMDAAESEHAALFGMSEGGPMAALFAATYPDRTSALILYSAFARAGAYLMDADELEERMREIERDWPNSMDLSIPSPTIGRDPAYRRHWQTLMRYAASPGAALSLLRMNSTIDIRDVLPAVRVPTLVMYRTDSRFGHGAAAWRKDGADVLAPGPEAHYLADHIPSAELVELDGVDQLPWVGDADGLIGEVQEFLTGVRGSPEPTRVLTTVLFVDIVGSTQLVVDLGDAAWTLLLERYQALVHRHLERFRGQEIDSAGDGSFASFDGPARSIRCGVSLSEAVRALGIDVRIGIHTGECELVGEKLGGIAVHIGARIAGLGGPGEVLVSSTVKDLVAGSGIEFEDRGSQPLKGVPGTWRLFAVVRS